MSWQASIDERTEDVRAALVGAASEVMSIENVTEGVAPGNSVRLRGRLLVPAHEAFEQLAARLRPLGRTPMLRKAESGTADELLALPVTFGRSKQRVGLALLLFGLTLLSCLFVGAQMPEEVARLGRINWHLLDGWPFAGGLLAILVTHEFGHYLMARRLGTPTSLPYFIPMPIGPFGTFGAFINMTAPPRNRRHLFLIGVAGPLAGLAVAIPVLLLGLNLSHVQPLPSGPYQLEGNSILYAAIKYLMFGKLLPSGGEDVFLHPLAFAGWAGLFVTALNLFPAGQLDGGHIVYALLGPKGARIVTWVVLAMLAGLTFFTLDWVLWLVLVFLVSRLQDMPLDSITTLTPGQRALAVFAILVFCLIFTPIPLTNVQ